MKWVREDKSEYEGWQHQWAVVSLMGMRCEGKEAVRFLDTQQNCPITPTLVVLAAPYPHMHAAGGNRGNQTLSIYAAFSPWVPSVLPAGPFMSDRRRWVHFGESVRA